MKSTKAAANREVIRSLGRLLRACRESQMRYANAAVQEEDSDLKELLSNYALQREEFTTELQAEIERLGGDPGPYGLDSADLGVDGSDWDESETLSLYEETMDVPLPPDARDVIERQSVQIAETVERLGEARGLGFAKTDGNSDSPPEKAGEGPYWGDQEEDEKL